MPTTPPEAFADVLRVPEVQTQRFVDDGVFPNNPDLPVVILRQTIRPDAPKRAEGLGRVFRTHGWRGQWKDGIFSYHHYHSTAHEVLGIAEGEARVQLGGPEGASFEVESGDVLVLPAGVAHKNQGASPDFLVVGAYPDGQDWDLLRGRPSERPKADRNIEEVSLPTRDPVFGEEGPLVEHWDLPVE